MDDFDDAQIAEAIARSMQDVGGSASAGVPPPSRTREVIEISDDEVEAAPASANDADAQFEADLQRALAASQAEEEAKRAKTAPKPPSSPAQKTPAPKATGSFLLDRAQLEKERLARQKRLRPEIVHDPRESEEDDDEEVGGDERSAKRQRVSPSAFSAPRANVAFSSTSSSKFTSATRSSSTADSSMFFDGELRQTANKHVDPAKDARPVFRLTEILAPRDDIAFAIMSAYVINFPWIYQFFDRSTPVIVATQDSRGEETIKEVLPNWIKTTPFLRGGRGCQHMKFLLLFYKTGRLRIVVATANLIDYDWRDIENSVWVQDVPLRPQSISHDSKATDFPATFVRVLRSLNVAPALINLMNNGHKDLPIKRLEEIRTKWDFTRVKVALVPSIAGKHEGWPAVILTGHTGLMKALRDIGARTPKGKELVLECQGSSIGTYSTQWMNEFYCSAKGESAESWLDESRTKRSKLPYPPIKILFPSQRTVKESVLGEQGGGTMFCRRAQWDGGKFPRDLFHDSKSKRGKVLMHSKMIIGTFRDKGSASLNRSLMRFDTPSDAGSDDPEVREVSPSRDEDIIGWAYVGSHNFTPSAWGTLSGSAFNPTLNVTNYELGILFPLRSEAELEKVACWERPPRKYVTGKDLPWMQEESACFQQH